MIQQIIRTKIDHFSNNQINLIIINIKNVKKVIIYRKIFMENFQKNNNEILQKRGITNLKEQYEKKFKKVQRMKIF